MLLTVQRKTHEPIHRKATPKSAADAKRLVDELAASRAGNGHNAAVLAEDEKHEPPAVSPDPPVLDPNGSTPIPTRPFSPRPSGPGVSKVKQTTATEITEAAEKRPQNKPAAKNRPNKFGVFEKYDVVNVPLPKSWKAQAQVRLAFYRGVWHAAYHYQIKACARSSAPNFGREAYETRALAVVRTLEAIIAMGNREVASVNRSDVTRFQQAVGQYRDRYARENGLQPAPTPAKPETAAKEEFNREPLGRASSSQKSRPQPKGSTMTKPKPKKKPAAAKTAAHKPPWITVRTEGGDRELDIDKLVDVFDVKPAGQVPAAHLLGKVIETEEGVYELVRQVTL